MRFLFIFKSSTTSVPTQDVFLLCQHLSFESCRRRCIHHSLLQFLEHISNSFYCRHPLSTIVKAMTLLVDSIMSRNEFNIKPESEKLIRSWKLFSDSHLAIEFLRSLEHSFSSPRSNFANKSNCYAILSRPDRMQRVGRSNVSIANRFPFASSLITRAMFLVATLLNIHSSNISISEQLSISNQLRLDHFSTPACNSILIYTINFKTKNKQQ